MADTPTPPAPAKPSADKPNPLNPGSIPGGNAHTDTKGQNEFPVDSAGRSIEAGDMVNVSARVKNHKDGKLDLEIVTKDGKTVALGNVESGHVTHSGINPRIGAAPQLRTPVVEVPAQQGGVKPIARDEYLDGKKDSSAGLPTATQAVNSKLTAAA